MVAIPWQPIVTGVSLPLCVRPFLIIFYGPACPFDFPRKRTDAARRREATARKGYVTWRIIGWRLGKRERERVKDDGKEADPRERERAEGRGKKLGLLTRTYDDRRLSPLRKARRQA